MQCLLTIKEFHSTIKIIVYFSINYGILIQEWRFNMYKLKIFAKSFLSLFAIMRLTGMSTKNPVSIITFLIILYVFSKLQSDRIESRIEAADITLAAILSVLFSIFTLAARHDVILGSLTSRLFCAIILLLTAFGLLAVYFYLII